MIKHQVLNYRASFPTDFIQQLIALLQQGQETRDRDEFSRQCFEIGAGLNKSENEVNGSESDELEDIIRLIESIRQGSAESTQKLAIVTRTLTLIRTMVKASSSDEKNVTEMAYLLQACRGQFYI